VLLSQDRHLVVTDWDMPEMTGLDLIRPIRQSKRSSYIYSILITSKSEKESLVAGLRTGADDYLTKPVHTDEPQARVQCGQRIIEMEQRLARQNRELAHANDKMKRDLDAAANLNPIISERVSSLNSLAKSSCSQSPTANRTMTSRLLLRD
jgi:sigma-B regulation protein RsbU (phosphoserine phosphatase)